MEDIFKLVLLCVGLKVLTMLGEFLIISVETAGDLFKKSVKEAGKQRYLKSKRDKKKF